MKQIQLILLLIFTSVQVFSQERVHVKDNVLQQLNDLISNGYEFLGKSEYQITTKGRPSSISGGDIWRITVSAPDEIDLYSKIIHIESGSGALFTIYISAQTKLAFCIRFTPITWATINDIDNNLRSKYYINDQGLSQSISAQNNQYISFEVGMQEKLPYVNIYAVDVEKTKYRFIE